MTISILPLIIFLALLVIFGIIAAIAVYILVPPSKKKNNIVKADFPKISNSPKEKSLAASPAPAIAEQIPEPEFYLRKTLLTKTEKNFFYVLQNVLQAEELNNKIRISFQVRLADVIVAKRNVVAYQANFNRITRKSLDFVLLDALSFQPLLIIELNDSTHNKKDRIERDEFLQATCKTVGLPLLFWTAQRHYNAETLATAILENLPGPK